MKVKYETNKGVCLTPCPFLKNDDVFTKVVVRVNSYACHECDSFVSCDCDKNIVVCKRNLEDKK